MVLMLVRCRRGIFARSPRHSVIWPTIHSIREASHASNPQATSAMALPHRFCWPHCGIDGKDYQICLRCGTAFEYDLAKMHRTRRLVLPTNAMTRR
jgi:hypothetical protein